jgi:hypothetical protein
MGVSRISNKQYRQITHFNNMSKLYKEINYIIYNSNNKKDAIYKLSALTYLDNQ